MIDLGLKKQLQGSFNSFSDSKPKIPEIHFQNLPISNEEIRGEFSESQWKCLSHCSYYYSKITCQVSKIKYLLFDIGLTILCFILIFFLDPVFKGFCQVCHHKAKYHQEKEEKETLAKQNLLVNVEILEKSQLLEVKCESTE